MPKRWQTFQILALRTLQLSLYCQRISPSVNAPWRFLFLQLSISCVCSLPVVMLSFFLSRSSVLVSLTTNDWQQHFFSLFPKPKKKTSYLCPSLLNQLLWNIVTRLHEKGGIKRLERSAPLSWCCFNGKCGQLCQPVRLKDLRLRLRLQLITQGLQWIWQSLDHYTKVAASSWIRLKILTVCRKPNSGSWFFKSFGTFIGLKHFENLTNTCRRLGDIPDKFCLVKL